MKQIEFVHHQNTRLALLQDQLGNFTILHLGTIGAINEQQADVCTLDGLVAALNTEDLDIIIQLRLATNPSGINELVALAIVSAVDIKTVTSRTGHIAHDGTLLAEHGIDEG
jgi:hypothetical protein